MGYAKYFNQKYKRSGTLFEGRYKSVAIKNDQHFSWLPYYVHFNPLDLYESLWRKREIKNYKKSLKFLRSYRWSSHLDYLGEKNFPSVTQRKLFLDFFGGESGYAKSVEEHLKNIDISILKETTLE